MRPDSVKKPVDSTWEILAFLRFILAMIVVATHVQTVAPAGRLASFLLGLSPMAAVLGFLIVSGFSIGHSISRKRDQFYRRRLLRIYPLYAIALIVPVSVQAMRGHLMPHDATYGIMGLLFLQNFLCFPIGLNIALWTIAIEAACYLLAPGMAKASTLQLLCIAGLSAIGFMVYPHIHPKTYYAFLPHGHAFFLLCWTWIAGFLFHRHRKHPAAPIVLTLAVFSIMSVNPLFTHKYYGLTLGATIAALTLCNNIPLHRWARKAMSFAGDVSFPMYLFHFPVFYFCTGMLKLHSDNVLILIAVLSGVAGVWIDLQLRRPAQVIFDGLSDAATYGGRSLVMATAAIRSLVGNAIGVGETAISMPQNVTPARLAA